MSSKLQSDVRCGGAIWWMFTGWRPGVVDWGGGVYAGLRRVQLFVSTCNGRPRLALQHHWLLLINCHFDDCKARLVRFPCKSRYIRITGFSFISGDSYLGHCKYWMIDWNLLTYLLTYNTVTVWTCRLLSTVELRD